ncbi:MAG TPA: M3 family metallopeptidase [Cyclobacteriaceae bacterium]|nr:M3 family metallopeptidase [Cyclobacteriaceae bacterium]
MKRQWILFTAIAAIFASCSRPEEAAKPYYTVPGNPLYNTFNEAVDFKALTAEHIVEASDSIIAFARNELQGLYAIEDGERTFNNTMLRLDDIANDLNRIAALIYLMGNTHPDSLIRTTALEKATLLEKFENEISLSEDLYLAVKSYAETKEAKQLTGYKEKYLRETVEDFERNGFALSEVLRDSLKNIKDAISEIGNDFNKNIAAYQDHLIVSEAEMDGLPEDYKAARKQPDGTFKIDLSYPSYQPFMKYSKSDRARKALYVKFNNRASDNNLELLPKLLRKRQEMARLLGYDTYAEWRLEDRMALNPETVWDFEKALTESVKQKADIDYQELLSVRKAHLSSEGGVINPWEAGYLNNILLEEKYQVNDEVIKEYFPLDNVLDGLFKITQTLFNVRYVEIEHPSVWHPDVRAFEVFDGDKKIGRFYLDLFPRDNKYTHAACFGMVKGKSTPAGYQIPNATLVCNFPSPTEGKPSLMPYSQVETFFHEFGHVLHQLLTTAELSAQSGTSVARDFVEAPSQIFENWIWNYESVKLFGKHYQTGDALPKELFDKMVAAKNVGSGLNTETQIFYGMVDMTFHDKFDPFSDKSTDEVVRDLTEKVRHYPFVEGTHFQAAFGHLNGYGASYYGYLWSRVYAEDMFSVFDQNGILDQETGLRYRNIILAKGSSEEPIDLVREFLGREPNNMAFMKSLGLREMSE